MRGCQAWVSVQLSAGSQQSPRAANGILLVNSQLERETLNRSLRRFEAIVETTTAPTRRFGIVFDILRSDMSATCTNPSDSVFIWALSVTDQQSQNKLLGTNFVVRFGIACERHSSSACALQPSWLMKTWTHGNVSLAMEVRLYSAPAIPSTERIAAEFRVHGAARR